VVSLVPSKDPELGPGARLSALPVVLTETGPAPSGVADGCMAMAAGPAPLLHTLLSISPPRPSGRTTCASNLGHVASGGSVVAPPARFGAGRPAGLSPRARPGALRAGALPPGTYCRGIRARIAACVLLALITSVRPGIGASDRNKFLRPFTFWKKPWHFVGRCRAAGQMSVPDRNRAQGDEFQNEALGRYPLLFASLCGPISLPSGEWWVPFIERFLHRLSFQVDTSDTRAEWKTAVAESKT